MLAWHTAAAPPGGKHFARANDRDPSLCRPVRLAAARHRGHECFIFPLSFISAAVMGTSSAALWNGTRLPVRTCRALTLLLLVPLMVSSSLQIQALLRPQEKYEETLRFDQKVSRLTETDALILFPRHYYPASTSTTISIAPRRGNSPRVSGAISTSVIAKATVWTRTPPRPSSSKRCGRAACPAWPRPSLK